jgi:hypothetical protein
MEGQKNGRSNTSNQIENQPLPTSAIENPKTSSSVRRRRRIKRLRRAP